jgi:transposase
MSNGHDCYNVDFIVLFDLVGLKIRQIKHRTRGGIHAWALYALIDMIERVQIISCR